VIDLFFAVCGIDYADSSAILKAVTNKGKNLNHKEQFYYYPWIVRLMKTTKMSAETISAKTICAGTLMNKQYILTAASCVFEWQKYFFQSLQNLYINPSFLLRSNKKIIIVSIGGGKINRRLELENDGPKYFAVKNIIVHPQYKPVNSDNNVALIQLKRTLKDPKFVPICLPSKSI